MLLLSVGGDWLRAGWASGVNYPEVMTRLQYLFSTTSAVGVTEVCPRGAARNDSSAAQFTTVQRRACERTRLKVGATHQNRLGARNIRRHLQGRQESRHWQDDIPQRRRVHRGMEGQRDGGRRDLHLQGTLFGGRLGQDVDTTELCFETCAISAILLASHFFAKPACQVYRH